ALFAKQDALYKAVRNNGKMHALVVNNIWNNLKKTLNQWRKENETVPLGRDYKSDDIKNIMERPFRILTGNNNAYTDKVENIFYLPDIVETEYLGAVDFEIIPGKHPDHSKLVNFLQDVQWHISKYIIELIGATERNYASVGVPYRDVYFVSQKYYIGATDTESMKYPGLEALCDYLNLQNTVYLGKGFVESGTLEKLFGKLRTHFITANGELGLYWRGYRRQAFEVACTVAGVIDILFMDDKFDFEGILRGCGPKIENLDDAIKDREDAEEIRKIRMKIPYLFKQLFQSLSAEKELFLIPLYREHFIHSFYCFVFGLLLMALGPMNVLPKKLLLSESKKEERLKLVRKWFMVSMWHDIAYMLQKGHEVLEDYVKRFIREGTRYRGLLPWTPSLGHLMQVHGLLEELRPCSENSLDLNKEYFGEKEDGEFAVSASDIIVAVAFDKVDHGVWSGLMFKHGWDNELDFMWLIDRKRKSKIGKIKRKEITKDLNEIVGAIMVHHVASWEVDSILNDFDGFLRKKFDKDKEDPNKKMKGHNLVKIDRDKNLFGYLLGICDLICQAGREAPEMAGKYASDIGIRIKDIEYLSDGTDINNSLEICLMYKNTDLELKKIGDDFFEKPVSFLGLNCDTAKNHKKALLIMLELEKEGSGLLPIWLFHPDEPVANEE
ncbi:MAG: hypothetical protein JRI28_05955, partial [Deltaproteobacteria bacterium]|nr:hypothetical protein [Deltaproteobacteria bacterium]